MSGENDRGRNAAALVVSTSLHLIILGIIINQAPPEYIYPEPVAAPAMEVEIVSMPPMPPITPPRIEPTKKTPTPAPKSPLAPAKPVPPKPEIPQPEQTKPKPPKPLKPTPPKPSPLPAPVAPAPTTRPTARPQPTVTLATPKTIQAAAKPTLAAPVSRPSLLNVHKALLQAPPGVPTLPIAPATGSAGKPGSPAGGATAASAGPTGASRLNGLSPYPYGAMPSGGPGLRGTLVGCANAEAVRLSGAERAHCNERFGVDIAHAPVLDAMSPTKRAAFDKAADRQEADRKYRNSTTDTVYAPSDPGGIAHGPASSETFKHNAGDPK